MKIYAVALLSIVFSFSAIAQECEIDGDFNWTKVQVFEVESTDMPKGFKANAEATMKISKPIKSLSDLNEAELKEIKKMAAKWSSCRVYVDVNGMYNSPDMPTIASQGQLYYYCVRKK